MSILQVVEYFDSMKSISFFLTQKWWTVNFPLQHRYIIQQKKILSASECRIDITPDLPDLPRNAPLVSALHPLQLKPFWSSVCHDGWLTNDPGVPKAPLLL